MCLIIFSFRFMRKNITLIKKECTRRGDISSLINIPAVTLSSTCLPWNPTTIFSKPWTYTTKEATCTTAWWIAWRAFIFSLFITFHFNRWVFILTFLTSSIVTLLTDLIIIYRIRQSNDLVSGPKYRNELDVQFGEAARWR